jgi:signal transduction histidine kinase
VQFDFVLYPPQALESEEVLFRICQEALANSLKHARAQHITIAARALSPEWVRVEVIDDGIGFDPPTAPPDANAPGGLGMQTMRERAAGLDGKINIESATGRGTRVVVELPRQDR